ncbi:MAG: nickel pincer cofactor biosynthesis protein LarB, partial [Cyanobium sp.]
MSSAASGPSDPGAILDLDRRRRLGMVEAVWGEHKSAAQIAAIAAELLTAQETVLVTRVSPAKAEAVLAGLDRLAGLSALEPQGRLEAGSLTYHPAAACLSSSLPEPSALSGRVAVLGGGSSDLTVASEAQLALRCHGVPSELLLDVGVAGLHRLLERLDQLRSARVLIACAGMEGALPTVLAGLLPQPVIAVPVSVGYGVSSGGVAALHGMLASCAP